MKFIATLFLLITITTVLVIISAQTNPGTQPGSCIEVQAWNALDASYGYTAPACLNVLQASQITSFWSDNRDIPDGNPTGSCAKQATYIHDAPIQKLAMMMQDGQPSTLCQQVFSLSMCFAQFHKCNSTIDGVNGNGYVTEREHKPCKWLCELLHAEEGICTTDDRDYLSTYGVILDSDDTNASLPQLNCNDPAYWSQDTDVCFAPAAVLPRKLAPRCEPYRGSLCSSVFPSGTMIYIPPGVEQEDMEARLPFSQMFNALPLNDNSCALSWTRHQCQIVFSECSNAGLARYPADSSTGLPVPNSVGVKVLQSFQLRVPMVSCDEYVESCQSTRVFSTPSVAALFKFPNCETDHSLHRNTCFPRGLTAENAIDYSQPHILSSENDYIPMNPQADAVVKTSYTMEQIARNNNIATIYQFNAKTYLKDRDYDEIALICPNTATPFVFFGQTRSGTSPQVDESSLPFPSTCPAPLISPTHYTTTSNDDYGASNIFGGRCALPCPSAAYTNKERRVIETLSLIFVIGAMVFTAILLLTLLVFRSQRHKRVLLWYTVSYFCATLFLFQGLMNRNGKTSLYNSQCETNTHLWSMGGFGLYQSLFLVYFLLASVCWWSLQATDLLERLVLGRHYRRGSRSEKRRTILSHLFCWGAPAICVIGIAVGGQFGYDGLLPFAFIAQHNQMTSDALDLSWPFFFGPIIVLIAIGLGCVSTVLYYFVRYDDSSQGLKKFEEDVKKSSTTYYKIGQILRLFGFVFLVIIFFALLVAHQVISSTQRVTWRADLLSWGENTLLYSGARDVPPVATRMHPDQIIMTVFALCSSGWISFVLYFVASNDAIKLWCGLLYFKLGVQCCKRYAKEDTRTDGSTDSSAGSSAHSSGHSNDLLTGDIVLTKSGLSNTTNTHTTSDTVETKQDAKDKNGSPPPPTPSVANSKPDNKDYKRRASGHNNQISTATEQERRNLLFRGFKNKDVGGAGSLRARSKSRDASAHSPPPNVSPATTSSSLSTSPKGNNRSIELQTLDNSPSFLHPQDHVLCSVDE